MVANWRVKIAMSLGLMRLPELVRRFFTLPGMIPCRRNAANTWFSPTARVSPRTVLPARSLPSHSKTKSLMLLDAAVAMVSSKTTESDAYHSLVTVSTSSSDVIPCRTLIRPDSRSERTPSTLACLAMSNALPLRKMMRWISSEIGITW